MAEPYSHLNNALNPWANLGHGPLPYERIRPALLMEVLLHGRTAVAGASLISNPATVYAMHAEPDLLPALLDGGHVVPLMTEEEPTLEAALERRIETDNTGITFTDTRAARPVARTLDGVIRSRGPNANSAFQRKALEVQKHRVARRIANNIQVVAPAIGRHQAAIRRWIDFDESDGRLVSGTWWSRLAGRLPGISTSERIELQRLGALTHDAGLAAVAGLGLVGASYWRTPREAGAALATIAFDRELGEIQLEDTDVAAPSVAILNDYTQTVSPSGFLQLLAETRKSRERYIAARRAFVASPTSSFLVKLKSRFDTYWVKLCQTCNEFSDGKYSDLLKAKKRSRSWLFSLRTIRGALLAIGVGGTASATVAGMSNAHAGPATQGGHPLSLVIAIGMVAGIGYVAKSTIDSAVKAHNRERQEIDDLLDRARPVQFTIPGDGGSSTDGK